MSRWPMTRGQAGLLGAAEAPGNHCVPAHPWPERPTSIVSPDSTERSQIPFLEDKSMSICFKLIKS